MPRPYSRRGSSTGGRAAARSWAGAAPGLPGLAERGLAHGSGAAADGVAALALRFIERQVRLAVDGAVVERLARLRGAHAEAHRDVQPAPGGVGLHALAQPLGHRCRLLE